MAREYIVPGFGYIDTNTTNQYIVPGFGYINANEAAAGGSQIKSLNGLAIASVKSRNGLAIASIKSINGLTNV